MLRSSGWSSTSLRQLVANRELTRRLARPMTEPPEVDIIQTSDDVRHPGAIKKKAKLKVRIVFIRKYVTTRMTRF